MIKVKRKIQISQRAHGRKVISEAPRPVQPIHEGRVPRISRLMALAIRYERLIRDGVVADISELARLTHVTQPRMTQIMNLNHLSPDIQSKLLFLKPHIDGRDIIHERMLRRLSAEVCFRVQRILWKSRAEKTDSRQY